MRITKFSIGLIVAGSMLSSMASAQSCELIKDIDFNNRDGNFQAYTQDMATQDFGKLEKNAAGDIRGLDRPGKKWRARNQVGKGILRANYPANVAGGVNSGILFDQKFAGTDEAVIEYRLKFGKNFNWKAGGKLPGLAGGEPRVPVGCEDDVNRIKSGFSSRLMWRKDGNLVVYSYYPNRLSPNRPPGRCGIDIGIAKVKDDQWYTVRQHIKMNTPGKKDGVLRVFIDGKKELDLKNVEYRVSGRGDVDINDFIFHTYRGGGASDTRFHSNKNEFIDFDDFKIWRNCSDPSSSSSGSGSSSSGSSSAGNGFKGSVNLPGRIQAENYTSAPVESSSGNKNRAGISQCTYYGLNVDVENASEGTCNVGWTTANEQLTYKVGTAGGKFNIRARVASTSNGRRVNVAVNGKFAGTVSTNGAGWQSWASQTISNVDIPSNATITVTFVDGNTNLNYLDITRASTDSGSSSSGSSSSGSSSSGSSNSDCTNVEWRDRAEIDLTKSNCITFDRNLSGGTLAIWDTDVESCDFRGSVVSVNGAGTINVDKNYVSSESVSGTSFRFNGSNSCKYVKVRAY